MSKCRVIDVTDIEWIEGRTYSDTFRFKSDPLRAFRVSYYNQKLLEEVFEEMQFKSESKARDLIEKDPIRIEKKMALIVDSLIKSGFQPHYIEHIKNEDCVDILTRVIPAIPPARRAILQNAANKDLQKRYNNVQIFLRHSGNMTKFTLNNFHTKIVIFQVLYGLGILQTFIKGFKHGNLTPSSVFIEKGKSSLSPIEYTIPGTSRVYSLPDLGFRARIGDFDYASGLEVRVEGIQKKALKNFKKDQQSKDNDVVYFLKNVKTTCPQTHAFVKRILKSGNGDAIDVLLDPYFEIFII